MVKTWILLLLYVVPVQSHPSYQFLVLIYELHMGKESMQAI